MGEDPSSGENVEYAKVALDELDRVERSISHLLRYAREEEMQVRGAFFPLIFVAIAAIVNAVVAVVGAVVAAVSALISGLIAGIGSILSGIGSFFTGLFTGNFIGALQGLFSGLLQGIAGIGEAFIAGAQTFQSALLSGFGLSSESFLGGIIGSNFVTAGLAGLKWLRLFPSQANFVFCHVLSGQAKELQQQAASPPTCG